MTNSFVMMKDMLYFVHCQIFLSGTRLELKGSRNYTSHPISVGTDEIFEDIVLRGLRADGFSSKLGVRNNKASIGKV